MIRLKTLLEQTTKKVPNVLFVTDNIEDRRKGFAKQLISNAIVTGDIRTVDKGSLAQLKDTLSVAISSYYDLVVVMTRGIYETNKNPEYGLTILESIKTICKTANIPLVLNTIPSVQFIKPEFAKDINFTLANDAEFDRFIQQTADYVLDTSMFNDDSFFNKTGIYLTRQAHERLYDEMINILNEIESADETTYDVGQTDKIIAEPGSRGRHVRALQRRLIEFGYEINERELQNQKFGDSTAAALVLFQIDQKSLDHCWIGHCSDEPGHRKVLDYLKKPYLLDLNMRLGEGSGAMAAVPLVAMACAGVVDVPTFGEWFGPQ